MIAACTICGNAFAPDGWRKRTCSTVCAAEHARRNRRAKEKRRNKRLWMTNPEWRARKYAVAQAKARRKRLFRARSCKTCGADITGRKSAQYCRPECKPSYVPPHPKTPVACARCGEPTRWDRKYCTPCRKARDSEIGWLQRRPNTPAQRERVKLEARRKRARITAAVQAYRMMHGAAPDQRVGNQFRVASEPYYFKCLVCGLPCQQPRWQFCSDSCRKARALERQRGYYHGIRLPRPVLPPKNVRTAGIRLKRRLREGGPAVRFHRKKSADERTMARERERERKAIFDAMNELGLVPRVEESKHDAH